MHDSVTLWKRGDTVYKEKYQIMYKDRWYDRYHTDTVIRRDSIRVLSRGAVADAMGAKAYEAGRLCRHRHYHRRDGCSGALCR